MASIVLGAAGAVVGSIFGGPLGASLGWATGSSLGGLFEKQKGQEGPRVSDLHIQNSQYGVMIPIAYGTVRIAGNVIWQTDLQEHSHSSGGKGGGPKITTYSYTVSFAVLLCEGPIVGITRIWANKRLVWSEVADNDFPFTLYKGTTTQLPDPTMEADKGVGNVSAHRGYAYVVFDDIPVEAYGNAIPSLEFEIIATGNVALQRVNTWEPDFPNGVGTGHGEFRGITSDGAYIYIANYGTGSDSPPTYNKDKWTLDGTFVENVENHTYATSNPDGDFGIGIVPVVNSDAAALISHGAGNITINTYWFKNGLQVTSEVVGPPGSSGVGEVVDGNPYYFADAIYAIGGNPTFVAKWSAPGGVPNGIIEAYYYLNNDIIPQGPTGVDVSVANDGRVWCIGTGNLPSPPIWIFDSDLNLLAFYGSGTGASPFVYSAGYSTFTVWNDYIVTRIVNTLKLWHWDGAVFSLVESRGEPAIYYGGTLDLGAGYFMTNDGVFKIPSPVTLKSIVDDLSVRSGLEVGEYDTDDLTQLVNGYVIPQQMDVRSALEPLMAAYSADAVESGPAIKYVNRGAAPDETIEDDDLAAYEEGQECPPWVTQKRTQEIDLPRSVTVSAFDMNADYQIGSQLAKRETVHTTQEMSITFALVLTPKEMKQIADRIMYDSWAKRRHISFTTARKWSKLEPTDVKIVHGYTLFITQRDEGVGGVLKFDGVATRSQIFGQSGQAGVIVGSGGFVTPAPPSGGGTADLIMLDLPLIGDGDYPNGVYAAISGFSGSANLYKSSDGGTSYTSLLTTLTPDTVGSATTVLANFGGGNVFDNINSVTVIIDLGGATLSSATQLAVLNGANEALIGSEIIQYKTATLTGTRTYVLTGLLRGRRGTEWAMGTHVAGENFVVLPTNVNVNAPFAELGLARKYKAVPAGGTLAAATAVDFINTGIALKCYAPVHVGGGRNASGDITLNWIRRTRIGGAWLDFVDVPLSEDAETYRIRLYSTSGYSTVLATVYVGTETVDILASDQTTYFGGLQSTLYWDVAQLGSYGYGYAARGIT